MRGRLVSLVVVIVLAAAPLARAMCELSCAEGPHRSTAAAHAHHAPAASTHDHHSVKHDSNTNAATALYGAPGVSASSCCADAERLLTSVVATKPGIEAPAIEVTFFAVADHQARDVSTITIRSAAPAASPPNLNTPLRV
jgi:hypothetical protein